MTRLHCKKVSYKADFWRRQDIILSYFAALREKKG